MHQPLVSVLLPVKNGERFLAAAIQSVLDQDYGPLELIVVDGQSNDQTREIAESFPVRYLFQSGDPGLAAARNLGIEVAGGELIAFISHDDLWTRNKLSLQVNHMVSHPEIQYTITRVKFFLEPGCAVPLGFRKKLLEGDYPAPMPETLVARKSLFRKIGGFNAGFTIAEDVDWFIRARDRNVPSAVIPYVLVLKRVHGANLSFRSTTREIFAQDILRIAKQSLDRRRASTSGD